MIKNKTILFIIIVISLLSLSCFLIDAKQTAITYSHSLETNSEFETIWNVSDVHMSDNWERPNIVGGPGRIIIGGGQNGDLPNSTIIAIDSISGNNAWTQRFAKSGHEIIIEEERLYRTTVGTVIVQCYNVENGELLWDTRLPRSHNTAEIYSAENKIFIHSANSKFFILNEDGEILDNFSESFKVFLQIGNVLYMADNLAIKAVDFSSKEELWLLDIGKRYRLSPIFDDGTIFLSTWVNPADVFSINQYTGEIGWKVSQDVLSNLYIADKKIYFVSYSGHLVTLDRYSGEEISRVMFSPSFDLEQQNGGYFVTGDPTNSILAIAFGDNTQVTGLKIMNP